MRSLYLRDIRRQLPLITLVSLAAAALVWAGLERRASGYEAYFSYLISPVEREESEDYSFDGYYALAATDLFAETVAQWLVAPETLAAAHEYSGVELPPTARQFAKRVQAQKKSAQVVAVTVQGDVEAETYQLTRGLQQVVAERQRMYQEQSPSGLKWDLAVTPEWVGPKARPDYLIVVASLVLVWLGLINLVILRVSWRES